MAAMPDPRYGDDYLWRLVQREPWGGERVVCEDTYRRCLDVRAADLPFAPFWDDVATNDYAGSLDLRFVGRRPVPA